MNRSVGLVIFDCDGVLVDSERLAVRTEAVILAELGWPLTEHEIIERFVGRSAEYMHAEVQRALGREFDWNVEFESRYHKVFELELQPVPGIVEALSQIEHPTCVASSGTLEKMGYTLRRTGLFEYFDGRIFSASHVTRGKPAPDIFLYAARQMDVPPSLCVIVEDSVAGVSAGVAAGMRVLGYAGSVTDPRDLADAGAVVFDQMASLPELINELTLG